MQNDSTPHASSLPSVRARVVLLLLFLAINVLFALVVLTPARVQSADFSPAFQNPYPTPPPAYGNPAGYEGPGMCLPDGNPRYSIDVGQTRAGNRFCFTVDTTNPAETATIRFAATPVLRDDPGDRFTIAAPAGCSSPDPISLDGAGDGVLTFGPYSCSNAGSWEFCVENDETGGILNQFGVSVVNGSVPQYGRLASRDWGFNQGSYCPGCEFQMTVVANCGSEIHIPLRDYENMINLRIYDSAGSPAPDGSWYVRRSANNGASWCRYWAWNGSAYVYNPDGDNCSGAGNCNPGDYDATCTTPLDPQITLEANAVSWFDPDMFRANQCNATSSYRCSPGNNPDGQSCDAESPGGEGEYMDVVIDLRQVGCGAIRLAADAGTTGFLSRVGATCNEAVNPTEAESFQLYFTGEGALPSHAVDPKPELSLKNNLQLVATEATTCNPGESYTSNIMAVITAENLSCGTATNAEVVFDGGAPLGTITQTVTLNGFGEQIVTADMGTITCECDNPQMVSVAVEVDPDNEIVECSESADSGEPVCNPPVGSNNTQNINVACNAIPRPNAIELAWFEATVTPDGAVTVRWETAAEWDHAGFNLYRQAQQGAPFTQINPELIASQGMQGQGALYEWQDVGLAGGTWYYTLEDVDVHGATTQHGPVTVMVGSPLAISLTGSAANGVSPAVIVLAGIGLLVLATVVVSFRKRV